MFFSRRPLGYYVVFHRFSGLFMRGVQTKIKCRLFISEGYKTVDDKRCNVMVSGNFYIKRLWDCALKVRHFV